MKTRDIHRTFEPLCNLGYQNLVVGGCSFTYNINNEHSSQWPYYVRDLAAFEEVYDCSVPGAGNQQIATSVQWALETSAFDPADTFIIVMWSGNTRYGKITNLPGHKFVYEYAPNVYWNTGLQINQEPMQAAQSVENYLHVLSLKTYLEHYSYPHIFLNFVDYTIPDRSNSFDIAKHLPDALAERYLSWFANCECIYRYCVRNNLLDQDDFHPSSAGHLAWSRDVLVPYIKSNTFTPYGFSKQSTDLKLIYENIESSSQF